MLIAYIRVSTADQNPDRQTFDGLNIEKTFTDKASGKSTDRPALTECLNFIREGDTLVCHSLDRLARNLDDLRRIVKQLTDKGIKVMFVKENLTFSGDDSAMSNLLLSVMGAFAEFERALIRERQREGIALAKASGKYKGRNDSLTSEQVQQVRDLVTQGVPKAKIARDFKVSRQIIYNVLEVAK
jgi:DNA invertase Pin-like site-specific DNA recombinase